MSKIIGLETEGKMDPKYGGLISWTERKNGDRYDRYGNLISTAEQRAKEDIPQWEQFEVGRIEIVNNYVIPGPNALDKDWDKFGKHIEPSKVWKTRPHMLEEYEKRFGTPKPKKIMPGDTNYTPLEKALNWASESHHGKAHQNRWNRMAATMGEDNGYDPYSYDEVKKLWEQFGKNARWTVAMDWFDVEDTNVEEMHHYHNAPPCQRHYTAEEFEKNWNQKPEIVNIDGWDFQMIIDPVIREPLYQLDGKGYPSSTWAYENGNWIQKNAFGPGPHPKGYEEPVQQELKLDMQEVIIEEAAVGLANESDPDNIKQMLIDLLEELSGK